MDKMSIVSVLFVSVPEVLLFTICVMLLCEYNQILDFTDKSNILKLIISTGILVGLADIGRAITPSLPLNSLIQFFFILLVLKVTYRINIKPLFIGVINSYIMLAIINFTVIKLVFKITNIDFDIMYKNDLIRILVSIPVDICQIIVIRVIMKIKKINYIIIWPKIIFLLYGLVALLTLIGTILIFGLIYSDETKYFNLVLLISCFYLIEIILGFLYISVEKKKRILVEKKRESELERISQLIQNGKIEQVIELINHSKSDINI